MTGEKSSGGCSMQSPLIEGYQATANSGSLNAYKTGPMTFDTTGPKNQAAFPAHLEPYRQRKKLEGTNILDYAGRNGNWNFKYNTRAYDPSKGLAIYRPDNVYVARAAI